MGFTCHEQLWDDYYDLLDYGQNLKDSRNKYYDIDEDDFISLCRLYERLLDFFDYVKIILDFKILASEMESEKDRFEVIKMQKSYFDVLAKKIDSFVTCGRSWKFEDYRCIDWEKQLVEYMLNVRDYFF